MSDHVRLESTLRFLGLTTTACGLALLSAEIASAKDPCYVYRPRLFTQCSRSAMNQRLDMQVAEAQVLSQTLWNHHFELNSSELRASGRAHLDRLVRKYPYGNFELSIQSAHDFRFTDDDPSAYFTHRRALDSQRTKAITDYLQHVIPDSAVVVQIHDRPPVGIDGNEALGAYRKMVTQGSASLPDDIDGSRAMNGNGGGQGGGDRGASSNPGFGYGGDSGQNGTGGAETDFSSSIPVGPSESDSGMESMEPSTNLPVREPIPTSSLRPVPRPATVFLQRPTSKR